jgi:hypothetical protein
MKDDCPPEQEIRNMAELRRREKMEDKAAKAVKKRQKKSVLRIHDILVWIRILLFSSLTFTNPTTN